MKKAVHFVLILALFIYCGSKQDKVEKIIDQLKGIGGEHPVFQKDGLVLSIPDAISRVFEKRYFQNDDYSKPYKQEKSLSGETCPECGQTISFEEGCMTCHFCGFTKCG